MKMSSSKSCALPGVIEEEKPMHRKPQFFSTGLSGVNFSWSLVMHSTLLSASRTTATSNSNSPTNSWTSDDSRSVSGSSSRSGASSLVSTGSSKSSSRSKAWTKPWSFGWRRHNKRDESPEPQDQNSALLLEKLPFTESGKFLPVYVGIRSDQTVKYVISRSLVTHPLLQVMLKVSEDELGKKYAVNEGVSIVCDPELFLEVVRAVDANLDSIRRVESEPEEGILLGKEAEADASTEQQTGPNWYEQQPVRGYIFG